MLQMRNKAVIHAPSPPVKACQLHGQMELAEGDSESVGPVGDVLGRRADPVVGRGAEDAKVTVMIVPQ